MCSSRARRRHVTPFRDSLLVMRSTVARWCGAGALVVAAGACSRQAPVSSSPSSERPAAVEAGPRPEPAAASSTAASSTATTPPREATTEAPELEFTPKPYAECGMPASLFARGWPQTLSPTSSDEPSPLVPGSVTLAVLPDTQYYTSCNSPHFQRQSRWIARTAAARNTVGVIQLGDLTERNTPAEWQFVVRSLEPLRGRLPTFLATGNHDYGDGGTANRRFTLFQSYITEPDAPTAAALAETLLPDDLENAYYRVKLPKVTLGVLVLEWSPRTRAVQWANAVLDKYPRDRVVFVTHAYLYYDGTRYDFAGKGARQEWSPVVYGTGRADPARSPGIGNLPDAGLYDGQRLWDELVRKHPGVFLTLSGHVLGDGAGVLTSQGDGGNQVHQVLTNFQMLREGGLGYLRLIELLPDGKTLRMKTYSPSLQLFATASDQSFDLEVQPPLW